jgi:hypothetical protein
VCFVSFVAFVFLAVARAGNCYDFPLPRAFSSATVRSQ